MPDPTKDVPGDAPTGQSDGRFDLGALGLGMPQRARVGTVIELGDEMDGAVEREEVTMAMIADVHQVPADGAVAVEDIELQEGEIRILGPVMGHDVDLRTIEGSLLVVLQAGEEDT
jgi:hypothetical protein